jgi:hypothetical protein
MLIEKPVKKAATMLDILTIGALWGIFEATVGYVLHLLPISIGWLIWYPAACFFLTAAYFKTRKAYAVLCVGSISAGIKLLNLLLPGSIDRVINPSVSILLEALIMFCAICVLQKTAVRNKPAVLAVAVLMMNTGWRLLYCMYILFIVPQWMRDISVLSNSFKLMRFLLIDNLSTSAIVFVGSLAAVTIRKRLRHVRESLKEKINLPKGIVGQNIRTVAVLLLLVTSAALQLLL